MKIGLTYDLRQDYLALGYSEEETAEFDRPDTVEAIERTLNTLGYETERIGNIWNLVRLLSQNKRWDLVFNIAEGLYGTGREAQVPALLDAYQIPYTFSDSLILALTLDKGMTKRVLRDLKLPTPDFAVIRSLQELDEVKIPFPLFAKPIAEGTGKGITATSKIENRAALFAECKKLLQTFKQPVLLEKFLPGREFTVGIVGTGDKSRSVGVMEILLLDHAEKDVYSYVNKEKCEELVEYRIVQDEMALQAEAIALAAWRGLGCRDAGRIDLRADEQGVPNLMELNPLAGIHPEHSDLPIICNLQQIPYEHLMRWIMESAEERLSNPDLMTARIANPVEEETIESPLSL